MPKRIARIVLLAVFALAIVHAEDSFFDSAGVRIHYTVEGQGDPVILIHGYAASVAVNWAAPGVIKGLADHYQVIAIDNRGHGQSGKPHDPAAYGAKMDDDILRLMDHLQIKKAHIVGYSMGGAMTLALMTQHPERFLSATLGGMGWQKPDDLAGMDGMLNQLADSLEHGKGIGPLIVALTPTGEQPPGPEQIEPINKMFLSWNDPLALAAVARSLGGMAPITEAQIRANKTPTLALIGEKDPLKASVDNLDGVMPHLKIVVIPGANHLTAFGNPAFLLSLRAFLEANSPSAVKAAEY